MMQNGKIANRYLFGIIWALAIGFGVFPSKSNGQDPRFSQFFASPLTLNPAYTGLFNGDVRFAGNYRNQWPTINRAFKTFTASVDGSILKNKVGNNNSMGVGFFALADEQADGVLKNTYAGFSLAYHKGLDLDGNHTVSLGFQGVYAQKRLNTGNLKFEDQLRSDGFTGITAEIFDPRFLNIDYWDLNAGLMFNGVFANNLNYYLGSSIYHINAPQESFRGANFVLKPRYTVHGGCWMPLLNGNSLHTSVIYQHQSSASEFVLGGAYGIPLAKSEAYQTATFYAGAWYRHRDAVIPYLGLEYGSWRLGTSYDVNLSSLKSASNSRGGFELSLIYIGKGNTERGINCPKF